VEGSLRAGYEARPRLSRAGRSLGFALGIWALGVCAASSAEARIETISWIHNNPTAVDGFRIYARYEGEGYQAPFYDGLPVPQDGVYSVSFDVDDNEIVYFVGTAYNELTESAFSNEIVRLPPVCGDGTVDPGEVCDDGNTANGDGCRSDCTEERCGDAIIDLTEQCDDGNTTSGDGCDAACRIEPDPVCGDGNVDPGEVCDDGNTTGGDGCRSNCTLELCGDGINDPGEMCDDGNTAGGDGCRSNCMLELCGDGVNDPGEQCDDGNTANGDGCDATCRVEPDPVCGDGTVDPGEQCDDGNITSGDGCDAMCRIEPDPVCGDGAVDPGEVCDDGNTTSGDGCRSNCTPELCGDGILDPSEQCDDGNTANDDGCDSTCRAEPDPVCGDGTVDSGEQCDDGNTTGGDGCDESCQIEEIEPPQLLANPDFDDTLQLASWGAIDPGVPPEWIPIDVDEVPNSGSALIENPYAGGVEATGLESECVPVTQGADYEWSSWGVRANSERGQRSHLLVGVAWYADPGCNGAEFQQAMASQSLNSGKWTEVAGRATAPPGSVGAVVRVMTLMDAVSSSESLIAQVDGVALFRTSSSSRGRGPRNRK